MTTAPTPLPRSGVISTGVGAGRSDDVARKMNHHSVGSQGSVTSAGAKRGGGGAMVDSYLSSFNNVAITTTTTTTTTGTTPRLEDDEDDDDDDDDEVFHDNNVTLLSAASCPFRPLAKKGPFPPVPPQPAAVSGRGKPPLKQSLGDLPGLSIVTWEEFLESPSVLCGLFEVDRDDFIRYNSQQVNVFFHDSRMEQPTLGAPSGDGLSWTIFIDSYNHLRSVRTWLTERVSVILLQLMKGKGKARAACLVAINPLNQSVGAQLNDSFSRVIDAFLQQRNFSIEVNLNSCVQTWCRTVLKMPCCVSGGRLVVTNAEESVPCTRVTSVSFCVLCFPVWGCQKLSYRFKRHTQYEDCFLYFKAEDLALCTKSPTLMQYAEKNNTNNNTNHVNGGRREEGVTSEGKPKPWIKKNRKAVTTATQTLDTDDDPPSGHMVIEEVVDEEKMGVEDRRGRQQQQHGGETERNQHSTVSSATGGSHTMQGLEPQTSNCFPSHRPAQSVTSRLRDPSQQEHGDLLAGSKSNLLSVSTVSSSSCSTLLPTADRVTLSSVDPTPRDGAHVIPVGSLQHPRMEEEEEEEGGEDSLSLHTPLTPRTPRGGPVWEDPRSAGLDSMSTLPSVGSDDEYGGGRYRLQPDTPSPRPDTPFHKGLPPQARKLARVQMVHDVIVDDESEEQGAANPWPPGGERVHHLKGSTAADLPPEPGSKRRKKRISKALRDMTGRGGQQATADSSSAGPPHLRGEEGRLSGRYNQAFVQDEAPSMEGSSVRRVKNGEKVKYTPIKELNENSAAYRAFPITSELLDFIGENSKNKSSCNPSKNSQDQKPKKKNSSAQKKAEDMLFASRFVLTEDRHNRNCLSDNDMVDDDFGDMEPDSVMSDVEGVASPRLIPVKKTERTISINSVYTPRSEADTDWEITDCELEGNARREGPKILAGARGAQQLRSTSANRTRESSTASSADPRRRGGIQNDSRRRYIALNSLRRKANQLALQAELRRQQKRPDSSGSARMEVQDV